MFTDSEWFGKRREPRLKTVGNRDKRGLLQNHPFPVASGRRWRIANQL
jgi:hypothetical protein